MIDTVFKNDRIAYHIEKQFRRGRSKRGVWGYLSDKSFLPETSDYDYNLKKENEIESKVETIFNLILEEGVGKLFYNRGKNKSPKFWFDKDADRANKFTTLPQ